MDFSALNKKQGDSFAEHKRLLQQLSKGKTVLCKHCQGTISLQLAEPGFAKVSCAKGCTDLLLQLG
ncbi:MULTISPECIES: hypothetical protein [unclassified Pseudoalteromonas]|uniref:hypothetical protein n=1 Tax=unclassified Pseudoalteromonas TaxID=194690 RepID=UPI000CF73F94|nr:MULTISPECIES: hypothetical protein [unclassified Pseudoalteromonas]MBS3797236.1 hypothetical protein [Pseudoalteromonas sp. BDTF-M6]